jgi:hypothetical protein
MGAYVHILGVDPGPVVGVLWLSIEVNRPGENLVANGARIVWVHAMQITPGALIWVLDAAHKLWTAVDAVALERFVVGARAARSRTPSGGADARETAQQVVDWVRGKGSSMQLAARSAADVKPWATDARLERAGLLAPTTGMRHARDAGRHALYCAVKDWADSLVEVTYHARSASTVKPWATDARLERAGLLDLTAGMRHARDAARHALFCAVKNCGLPDPLSAKAAPQRHNHMTRDIRPRGECPACDRYHDNEAAR